MHSPERVCIACVVWIMLLSSVCVHFRKHHGLLSAQTGRVKAMEVTLSTERSLSAERVSQVTQHKGLHYILTHIIYTAVWVGSGLQ